MSAFSYRLNAGKTDVAPFQLYFNACTREAGTWKEELYASARAIAGRAKKKIWVCSSGGIDSEIACRAFYDQGILFSVLTLEHNAATNRHDIQYAVEWCRERGVEQKLVRIDMPAFLTSEVDTYAKRYIALHPFRYLQIRLLELIEEMGGYAVLGGGEQVYRVDTTKPVIRRDDMYITFSNGNIVPLEWCKDHNTDHEPYFHLTSPELCLSYLRLPLIAFTLDNPETVFRHAANAFTLKRLVYQSVWPGLEVRYKTHGFEKIMPLVQQARARLRERFERQYIKFDVPISAFEEQLTGVSVPKRPV